MKTSDSMQEATSSSASTTSLSFLFVINPNASGVSDVEALQAELCQAMGEGADCRFVVPSAAERMAAEVGEACRARPAQVLVAVGGDGLIRQLIPVALKQPDMTLGVVPLGTGNLLASALGIASDLPQACAVLRTGSPHRLHVGVINNREYFTLSVGVGIDADIMKNASSHGKKTLGKLAYVLEGLRQLFSPSRMQMDLWLDGRRLRRQASGAMVIHNRDFLVSLNPFAQPSIDNLRDDVFDVCVLDLSNPLTAIPTILQLITQDFANPALPMEHFRARHVRIQTRPRRSVQADGDVLGKTPVSLEIRNESLPVLTPLSEATPSGAQASAPPS